jgi:hypothetical protein
VIQNHEADTSYLLYQCGSEVPDEEVGKHNMTVSVPLEDGVVIGSSTMIPHLEQLGLRYEALFYIIIIIYHCLFIILSLYTKKWTHLSPCYLPSFNKRRQIKGILGDPQYIASPCINTLVAEGSIKGINDGLWYSAGINLDDFLLDAPNAVVLRGLNQDANAMVISESQEEESLDIYEWHKLYGALFNIEATATKQFDEAEERYECVSDMASSIVSSTEAGVTNKPKVVWASHSTWSTPAFWDVARCDEKNNYYCEFANRCQAELLHSNDGSIENYYTDGDYHMTDEEFFEFAKDADHWIYTSGNWDATLNKFSANLTEFKSVRNEEVYDTEGSGNGVWFEQRIAEFGKQWQQGQKLHYDLHCDLQWTRFNTHAL